MSKDRNKNESTSLVLSIFKGLNFINKNRHNHNENLGVKITAKLSNVMLETGVFPFDSSPEIHFNSQLAWLFNAKELQELRSNKQSVKIEVWLMRCGAQITSMIGKLGYIVLYVNDSFVLNDTNEVSILNAKETALLGTTTPWRDLNLKLQLLFHIEDKSKIGEQNEPPAKEPPAAPASKRHPKQFDFNRNGDTQDGKESALPQREMPGKKEAGDGNNNNQNQKKMDTVDSTKIPTPRTPIDKLTPGPQTWVEPSWKVNVENGYFELGSLCYGDDLYVMNIIVVSSSHLHLLPGQNIQSQSQHNDDDNEWMICFKSFGCEIKSEPFKLKTDSDSKNTFIGDKSTARIRSNGGEFHQWLMDSSVEFQVKKMIDGTFHTLGVSFVQLNDFTLPDVQQMKVKLELVSELDISQNEVAVKSKPEIRVLIELEAFPNYFKDGEVKVKTESRNQNQLLEEVNNNNNFRSKAKDNEDLHLPSLKNQLLKDLNDHIGLKKPGAAKVIEPADPPLKGSVTNNKFKIEDSNNKKAVKVTPPKDSEIQSFDKKSPTANAQTHHKTFKNPYVLMEQQQQQEISPKVRTKERVDFENWKREQEAEIRQHLKSGKASLKHANANEDVLDRKESAFARKSSKSVPQIDIDSDEDFKSRSRPKSLKDEHHRKLKTYKSDELTARTQDYFCIEKWKKEQKEQFKTSLKKKEETYLKILSEEWRKRDKERDEYVKGKMSDLAIKEDEMNKKINLLAEKEEYMCTENKELKDRVHTYDLEMHKLKMDSELNISRMKDTHKYEIESLSKRISEYKSEIEKLRGDVAILRSKLDAREQEIFELKESRNKWPDIELAKRYELLEQKHKALNKEIEVSRRVEENYKSRIKSLTDDLKALKQREDLSLKSENENLRLQLLAAREKRELSDEFNTVRALKEEIRAMKKSSILKNRDDNSDQQSQRTHHHHLRKSKQYENLNTSRSEETQTGTCWNGRIRRSDLRKDKWDHEKQIEKLVSTRDDLLCSGAYNDSDTILVEIKRRIASLVEDANYNI